MLLEVVKPEDAPAFRSQIKATSMLNFEDYGINGVQPSVPLEVTYPTPNDLTKSTNVNEKAPTAPIAGGLVGYTFASYLYINLLWVSEDLRTGGVGSALMLKAEEEGRKRGCTMSLVNTFSFQAEGFYIKHGYSAYARLSGGFGHQATRIRFSKSLLRYSVGYSPSAH